MELVELIKSENKNKLDKIAKNLFFHYHLNINGKIYRILEIEYYFYNDNHSDVFTHGRPNNANELHWRFHKAKESEKYSFRGGTYKGLDIAYSTKTKFYAILIRSIMHVKTG